MLDCQRAGVPRLTAAISDIRKRKAAHEAISDSPHLAAVDCAGEVRSSAQPMIFVSHVQTSGKAKPNAYGFLRRSIACFVNGAARILHHIAMSPAETRDISHHPISDLHAFDACSSIKGIAIHHAKMVFMLVAN
jgi:hypothetical protein